MVDTEIFTIEGSSVSDGSTEQLTEADDESYVINKVQVIEESGTDLNGSTASISIAGDSITDQNVPISALQEPHEDLRTLDLEWPSNRQFEFDWTNSSGSSATINVVLYVTQTS